MCTLRLKFSICHYKIASYLRIQDNRKLSWERFVLQDQKISRASYT